MIDIMAIREYFKRRELAEIRFIHGKENLLDAMTIDELTIALQ